MPPSVKEDIIEKIYNSDTIQRLILERLEFFREMVNKLCQDNNSDGSKIPFKTVFGIWGFSTFGARVMGKKDDEYYIDENIDTSLWDWVNIQALEKKLDLTYGRTENEIKQAWKEYTETIYHNAFALSSKRTPPVLNFRSDERWNNSSFSELFNEALVFPFPHYSFVPIVTWGAPKSFIGIFHHDAAGDIDKKVQDEKLSGIQSVWEHFEAQLWEQVFFRSVSSYDLSFSYSFLTALLSIYRPALAWISAKDEGGVLQLEKIDHEREHRGFRYIITQQLNKDPSEYLMRVESLSGFASNSIIMEVVKELKAEVPMPVFLKNKADWTLVHVSMTMPNSSAAKQELHLILPYKCNENTFKTNFVYDLHDKSETLRYLLKHADLIWTWAHKSRNAHIKSAIAAIMGRNMSHNLGSHALGYIAENSDDYSHDDLGALASYIQKRMDFIAQISTSTPSWCLSLPWSLNTTEDGDVTQYPNRENDAGEWINTFDTSTPYALVSNFALQFALLDNIVRSDNLRFRSVEELNDLESASELPLSINLEFGENDTSTDFTPDIPHGQIGAHALYSILENLLRNAAKYRNEKAKPLSLTVTINKKWKEKCGSRKLDQWRSNYYQATVTDNEIMTEEEALKLCESLNGYLENPIIDPETAELAPGQWGIKEIKICAAYLRLIAQENIDRDFDRYRRKVNGSTDTGEEPPIIEVYPRQVEGENYIIEYCFYLLRPKEALFVGCDSPNEADELSHKNAGIDHWSWGQLEEHIRTGGALRHQFLVFQFKETGKNKDLLKKYFDGLPCRIFTPEQNLADLDEKMKRCVEPLSDAAISMISNPTKLRLRLWEEWCTKRCKDGQLIIRWGNREWGEKGLFQFIPESQDLDDDKAFVYDHVVSSLAHKIYTSSKFHECLDEGTAKSLLREIKDQTTITDENRISLLRLREASAISVAILDERVFDCADHAPSGVGTGKYQDENLTFHAAWAKRRVYLLDHSKEDIGQYSQDDLPGLKKGELYDFLIVHQGLLDKWCKESSEKNTLSKFGEDWEALRKRARVLIIDTGRGKPSEAASLHSRWLEYSSLAEAVFRGSKLQVATLLFALQAEVSSEE